MTKTNRLISAMRNEKLARELLRGIDWIGLVELLKYRGLTLRVDQENSLVNMTESVHTGTIIACREVLVDICALQGGSTTLRNILAVFQKELIGATAAALELDDTLQIVLGSRSH